MAISSGKVKVKSATEPGDTTSLDRNSGAGLKLARAGDTGGLLAVVLGAPLLSPTVARLPLAAEGADSAMTPPPLPGAPVDERKRSV